MKKVFLAAIPILIIAVSCKKSASDSVNNPTPKDSVITTVAGNGTWGFSGDDGLATAAQLSMSSKRVCVGPSGNIYISDGGNNRIRKVSLSGIITTIAGNGISGFSGDGGPATAAKISGPQGLSIDAAGNIYFADEGNGRIRKINTAGIITTVAGNGLRYSANEGDGGPATADTVSISLPHDVAIDKAGNLIIADYGNSRVRKVNSTTGIISTIAGGHFTGTTGNGDGGAAINAKVRYPTGIAIDEAGNMFIASSYSIRKVNTSGNISTVAGIGSIGGDMGNGGLATSAFVWPVGIAINNIGELVIADYGREAVRKIDKNGIISIVAGGNYNPLGDGGKPSLAGLTYPTGISIDATGNIYIADYGDRRIRKITVK